MRKQSNFKNTRLSHVTWFLLFLFKIKQKRSCSNSMEKIKISLLTYLQANVVSIFDQKYKKSIRKKKNKWRNERFYNILYLQLRALQQSRIQNLWAPRLNLYRGPYQKKMPTIINNYTFILMGRNKGNERHGVCICCNIYVQLNPILRSNKYTGLVQIIVFFKLNNNIPVGGKCETGF